jgi:hypothetical protein
MDMALQQFFALAESHAAERAAQIVAWSLEPEPADGAEPEPELAAA